MDRKIRAIIALIMLGISFVALKQAHAPEAVPDVVPEEYAVGGTVVSETPVAFLTNPIMLAMIAIVAAAIASGILLHNKRKIWKF